jgi:carbon monoxide dehydrogenase subunit G
MELKDTKEIAAPRADVWGALLSAEVLKECVPGCQEMTGSASEGFEATVVQKVGPVKATFKGAVTLSDIIEGESLTLTGEGKGGAAGFAKGGARVHLADGGPGTVLTYEVEAKVGGKLAQLGSRIIDSFAKKMADQFFERFQGAVEGDAPTEDTPAQAAAEAAAEVVQDVVQDAPPKKGLLKRLFGG